MPRSNAFYFGTMMFFVGILFAAVGVSSLIAGRLNLLTAAELASGVFLVIMGYRALRKAQ